jgi:glycosyltransferase involved in cell wall biosynthesis
MAASKPVVVSNKSGASEIIQSGQNGIVVEEPNPKNMAAQIDLLISNPELRRKIGENAYKYTQENLSWEIYAKNMEFVFKKAVQNFKKA